MGESYPSESTLERIRKFNPFEESIEVLLNLIESEWWAAESLWTYENNILEIHTGGWSENEDIIEALEDNQYYFWELFWWKSERGGHYWFEIKDYTKI